MKLKVFFWGKNEIESYNNNNNNNNNMMSIGRNITICDQIYYYLKKKKKKPKNGQDLVTRCHALQIPNKILIHKSWTLIKLF